MEKEMENYDGDSNRNDEDVEKGQLEGGERDSGIGNGTNDMELDGETMDEMLREVEPADGVAFASEVAEGTPAPTEERETPPQTSEKVVIPVFASIETGKQFVLPEARAGSRRDQVVGSTATKAAAMRAACKEVQAVTYEVRADTAEGLRALREKIKVNGGALWEDGVFMAWSCVTATHRSGRQVGVTQNFFLRSETLPESLEAMAKSSDDSSTHWRGCIDWTKEEGAELQMGSENYQCCLDTMHGTRGIKRGCLWGLEELADKHGYHQVQAEVQVELKKRYQETFPGEAVPCMGVKRQSFARDGNFGFTIAIADEDARLSSSKMLRVPLEKMRIFGEEVSLTRVSEQEYVEAADQMRKNRVRTDFELEVMVWNVDSTATEGKLKEGVLAALQEAGAPFETKELAAQEVVSTELKRGRKTNRLHGVVRLKTKEAVEALVLCQHQVADRLGYSVYLKKSQSPEERAKGQARRNGYSDMPVPRRGAAQPEEAAPQPSAHAKTYMEVAAQQGMSAAQQKAVGEMIDASSDKIAQKVVARLEAKVKSLETALEKSQKETQSFFSQRDIMMMETLKIRDADLLSQMANLVEVSEGNLLMQMDSVKGAVEQIRDKDMEVSSDDGFYSDVDEEEEEEKEALSYDQVEGLSETGNWGEDERQIYHRHQALKAAMLGHLNEQELQALVDQRQAEYKEKQWALAEAQRGMVAAGSTEKVETFVAEAQKAADTLTKEALEERTSQAQEAMKKAEEMVRELETQKKSFAEEVKGRKRAAGGAVEREGRSGRPTKKGQHLLPRKSPKRTMAIGYR